MPIDKEKIKKNVMDHLFWDARVDSSNISIDVSEGQVKLTGTVPTTFARTAAEQDAWSVSGVKFVINDIRVRYPERLRIPDDTEIKNRILQAIDWNTDIDSSDVKVHVDNAVVTLDGSVPSYWQKVRTEELILNTSGVIYLTNRLAVVPTKHYVDELIASDIEASIERTADININNIDIQVQDGKVVLSGTVTSWIAFNAAENAARNTEGVLDVKNNIVIS